MVVIFLTVCTRDRLPILATARIQNLLIEIWQIWTFWLVGRYIIMPDHIHLFCTHGKIPPTSLKGWVSCWKSDVTRKRPCQHNQTFWQKDFWDTQLRRGESYSEKWYYVRNNPVRYGYVECVEELPYQGEIHQFGWHD